MGVLPARSCRDGWALRFDEIEHGAKHFKTGRIQSGNNIDKVAAIEAQ